MKIHSENNDDPVLSFNKMIVSALNQFSTNFVVYLVEMSNRHNHLTVLVYCNYPTW